VSDFLEGPDVRKQPKLLYILSIFCMYIGKGETSLQFNSCIYGTQTMSIWKHFITSAFRACRHSSKDAVRTKNVSRRPMDGLTTATQEMYIRANCSHLDISMSTGREIFEVAALATNKECPYVLNFPLYCTQ